jgi:hypothetical protein
MRPRHYGEVSPLLPLVEAAPEVGLQPYTDDFDAAVEFLEAEGYIEDAGPRVNVARRQAYMITPKGAAWVEF